MQRDALMSEEKTPKGDKKLLTSKRVVLVTLAFLALGIVLFLVWENFGAKMYTDSTIQAQQSIQEMQKKGVSF